MKPSLSVVMAVYNQAETLNPAVKSILEQSFPDFALVIVDDHSTDETPELLRQWRLKDKRVKVITNSRHLGLTKSLNVGLKQAKTRFIARMDGDDVAMPERLKRQRDYLLSHPKIGLLGTAVRLIDEAGKPLRVKQLPSSPETIRQSILSGCPFIHPTWMLRKSVLDEVGVYNEAFSYAQDYDLALRIVSRFLTANLLDPLLNYRVNSGETISLKHLKQQEWLALRARWLALTKYGYSITEAWRLVKPVLSFAVPAGIKKLVYARYYW
ncbi:MAG: Glycosyltransferase [Candidatus Beckwithbacteria bacterium GW2011_GWC2_47_9]|uniref:Glycosyltransferase n=2 Tax=Candidatus Beckwithiibacteriota TaxID=1752726 RepID=A0A0G1U076_9BACT|nr:MAG: Glycosyltransferase [Candidatus Beckwithbacteria bacterium GW2011_GWC2_47_9]